MVLKALPHKKSLFQLFKKYLCFFKYPYVSFSKRQFIWRKHYDNMLLHAKESFSLASLMSLAFFLQLLYQI